ncbi:hypothetical protein [Pseudomonas sp. NPDC086251]|uniref:hypothetical protein n=1 Tax=Pseudomonas sp. NPDC086251 TaxID=3364431 RepID=UPI003837C282
MTFNNRIPVTNSVDMATQIVVALIAAGLLPSDAETMTDAQWEIANILSVHFPAAAPCTKRH